jgi:predicted nucleic acid-binding protein
MRVVLDTNIIVSARIAAAGKPAAIIDAWLDGRFTLLTCAAHVDELRATLQKPRVAELESLPKRGSVATLRIKIAASQDAWVWAIVFPAAKVFAWRDAIAAATGIAAGAAAACSTWRFPGTSRHDTRTAINTREAVWTTGWADGSTGRTRIVLAWGAGT